MLTTTDDDVKKTIKSHSKSNRQSARSSLLSSWEKWFYALTWTSGVLYCCYLVYIAGKKFQNQLDSQDFSPGWSILRRYKDHSDDEWLTWLTVGGHLTSYIIFHFLASQITRAFCPKVLPYVFVGFSCVVLAKILGLKAAIFLIGQLILLYLVHLCHAPLLIWAASFGMLVCINLPVAADFREMFVELYSTQSYVLSVTMAWAHARAISYCLDQCEKRKSSSSFEELMKCLAYCLYFPLLFFGPLVIYKDFEKGLEEPYTPWTLNRIWTISRSVLRYIFWLLFNELILHFFYFSSFSYNLPLVQAMDLPTLCGFAYCMGQFFMNKYVVMYGLPATIARAEQFYAPSHPKCIGRIARYSEMWKFFDQGLHQFMLKYIYIPSCGSSRSPIKKVIASFLCFSFVYLWHGTMFYIFIWAMLNFIGICIETLVGIVASTKRYQNWETSYLSPANQRRFHALLTAPLYLLSIYSNMYFFAGVEVGNYLVERSLFHAFPFYTSVILFFLYCCCHVAVDVREWERRKSSLKRF